MAKPENTIDIPDATSSGNYERARILIVDDQALHRELLLRQFIALGLSHCDSACDGAEALDMLKRSDYDVVFTDCIMPVMDGVELIQRIRRLESFGARRVYLVALTASESKQHRQRCLHAGADEVYVKPVNALQISNVVQRAFTAIPCRQTADCVVVALSEAEKHALSVTLQEMLDIDMACIRRAIGDNNSTAAMNAAHRIAGAARWLQLTDIAVAAALLEEELACHRCTDASLHLLEGALEAFSRRQRNAS